MFYFKNSEGQVFAYDSEEVVPDGLVAVTEEEAKNIIEKNQLNDPRQVRDETLAALVHDFGDGRVIQCRPHPFSDESNMRNAIEQMGRLNQTERLWFGADNTAVTVTAADLQTAIESGQDQSAVVWTDFFTSISG